MDNIYIINKLNEGEGTTIEFKESQSSLPKSFYETAVSFSNTDGGIIILGVNDSGSILGIDKICVKQIIADIITNLNSPDCITPSIYVNPIEMELENKTIIIIQIPSSSSIHTYKGSTYFRASDVDINISNDIGKIQEIAFQKSNNFTESIIYPHLTMKDLDSTLFKRVRTLIRNYRSDHPWLFVNDEQMLRESLLWRKDNRTGEQGLTLAAALIFGKDIAIQSILPAYKVEAMIRIKNLDRYDDRITLRTNLLDTYIALKEFINKHLDDKFYLEGDQRIDLRDKIFREVIGNLVVHREYTSAYSTDLIIYNDSVVVTNPNKPIFHGVLDPLKFNPYPKNPNIRKFFTAFGWTDEIGSGVRNTNKYLPIYTGGAKPIFIEDDIFKVEIPLENITLNKFKNEWTKWLELSIDKSEHLAQALANIPLGSDYINLNWEDLILKLLPSWNEKGTQLLNLSWTNNQVVLENEIKKVPSWNEKGTQILRVKIWYYMAILSLCGEPISANDLLVAFDYKNDTRFKNNYIKPLRESGLITLTNTIKPTSPDNKYVITEEGKRFLAG